MGIVVNQPANNIKFPDLLVQLDVVSDGDAITVSPRHDDVMVLKGGPVETGRGFVLHSADFFIENSTLPIDEGICLTATHRHPEGDRDRRRSVERDPRARLCRLGAGPARGRDPE